MPRKKETALDKLLARVTIEDVPEQEDAATYAVDPRSNTAVVRLNPAKVTGKTRHEHTLRGAARLVLRGFGGYNRTVQRAYGTYEKEQRLYSQAEAAALTDIEALLHQLHPYAPPEPDEGADSGRPR